MVIMLAFELWVSRTLFEEFLICGIHIVYGVCQGKFIDFLQPSVPFLSFPAAVIITICFADEFLFIPITFPAVCQSLVINETAAAICFCNLYFCSLFGYILYLYAFNISCRRLSILGFLCIFPAFLLEHPMLHAKYPPVQKVRPFQKILWYGFYQYLWNAVSACLWAFPAFLLFIPPHRKA